jgi:AcrR family transcriptional regulator
MRGGGDVTREKIKRAAEILFAERGFNAVSIRDIIDAAGQRNTGSLHYYFRTKEALARELVQDGVRRIDQDRNQRLDRMEAQGGPKNIREIIELLAYPYFVDDAYMRFLSRLMQDNYGLFLQGAEGQDSGFKRVIAHVRRLLPDIPAPILKQRFHLMIVYLTSMIALQNGSGEGHELWSRFWNTPGAEETLLDTVEGMLRQPVSAQALAALAPAPRRRRAAGAR